MTRFKPGKKKLVGFVRRIAAEPTFILRAQDMLAPEIVREWAYRAAVSGSPAEKVEEAREIATKMEDWQIANSRKIPD